jgi:hypothetical protein
MLRSELCEADERDKVMLSSPAEAPQPTQVELPSKVRTSGLLQMHKSILIIAKVE